jgi:hypothetical protein
MDWYDITGKYHSQTFSQDCRLSSLPENWQRELAATWRLEADVNNGGYLQFLSNWGRESYVYASRALNKISARRMAEIIDRCQALIDEHITSQGASQEQMQNLMPNPVTGRDDEMVQEMDSILPDSLVRRIDELSHEFMNYPDDVATLGIKYYRPYFEGDGPGRTNDRRSIPADLVWRLRRFWHRWFPEK